MYCAFFLSKTSLSKFLPRRRENKVKFKKNKGFHFSAANNAQDCGPCDMLHFPPRHYRHLKIIISLMSTDLQYWRYSKRPKVGMDNNGKSGMFQIFHWRMLNTRPSQFPFNSPNQKSNIVNYSSILPTREFRLCLLEILVFCPAWQLRHGQTLTGLIQGHAFNSRSSCMNFMRLMYNGDEN